ncbi:MAG: cob(I)yrinic acid a,c-diamide adenosyltransferase [Oscillospiraceae bacterium]|nr:cob(I)yrinic acid a,c-diamide adenosyltransferase [Oscillospiraceae bacterium]
MPDKGLIHVYYGDGKGKTTAALGLAVRAAGCGKNVVIVQFLKNWQCGEHNSLSNLPNVSIIRGKTAKGKFIHEMNDDEKLETKTAQDECLKSAVALVDKGQCDMLILDEVIDAHNLGVIDSYILEDIIYKKPDMLELVITGHNAEPGLLEHADYVTEMVKHKHPYDVGVKARQGIEF